MKWNHDLITLALGIVLGGGGMFLVLIICWDNLALADGEMVAQCVYESRSTNG